MGPPLDPTDDILTEVALKPAEVAAAQTDINVVPTPDTTPQRGWTELDPDRLRGRLPAGSDGRSAAADDMDHRSRSVPDVGNVDKHSLLLAPAERGDVVVDFSKYAGKTLILYNDVSAAFPARVAELRLLHGRSGHGRRRLPAAAMARTLGPSCRSRSRRNTPAAGVQPDGAQQRLQASTPTAPASSSPARTRSSSDRPATTPPTARPLFRAVTAPTRMAPTMRRDGAYRPAGRSGLPVRHPQGSTAEGGNPARHSTTR